MGGIPPPEEPTWLRSARVAALTADLERDRRGLSGSGVSMPWSEGVLGSSSPARADLAMRRLESPVSEAVGERFLEGESSPPSEPESLLPGDETQRGAPPPEPTTLSSSLLEGLPL